MSLQFKEEQYGWGDTFYVVDENNQRKYYVESGTILWNKKVEIRDLNKQVLAVIKNEPKSIIKKKFYISIGGKEVASITREILPVPKVTIEGLDWEMRGLMLHEYDILQNGQEVLSFHQETTDWSLRPVLNVANPDDELLALAIVIAISYATNMKEDSNPTNHL